MPVASLSKLSIPLPPGQSATNQGLLMPKLKYRFRVTVQNFGVTSPKTELTKQVISCSRPEVSMEPMIIDVYNSQVKLAGKPKWSDITLLVRDDASNVVSQLVGEQVQKQFDFFEQSSAASGIDYKFTTIIEILDGGNGANTPNVLETFELDGCFINKVTYQGGDYKTSEAMDISMIISFDNAIQVSASGTPTGLGTPVARPTGTLATG